MSDKIKTIAQVLPLMELTRFSKERIVFTNGCFDLFHAGHVHLLKEAATFGDVLVVGINSDESVKKIKGPFRPIVPERQRAEVVAAVGVVDYVVLFDDPTPQALIESMRPHVLVKGRAYEFMEVAGSGVVERVEYVGEVPGLSASSIIHTISERLQDECNRKSWSLATL